MELLRLDERDLKRDRTDGVLFLSIPSCHPSPPHGGVTGFFFFFQKVTDGFWGRVGAGQAPKAPKKILKGFLHETWSDPGVTDPPPGGG